MEKEDKWLGEIPDKRLIDKRDNKFYLDSLTHEQKNS
jgi:hypothetical protein